MVVFIAVAVALPGAVLALTTGAGRNAAALQADTSTPDVPPLPANASTPRIDDAVAAIEWPPRVLLLPGVRRGGFDGGQSAGLHGNHPLDANAAAHDIALRDKPGVATQSIGEESNRRVVILARNVWRASRVPVLPAEPIAA